MIDSIDLRGLRNSEYLQYMEDFTSLVDVNDPVVLNVAPQNTALKAKETELEELFKLSQKNEITEELVKIDQERDNAITGISFVVTGFMYSSDPILKKAANYLNENLKVYGSGIARLNFQSETATITSIIGDWESKPNLIQSLTDLNLNHWKDELKASNLLFDQRYLARTQEYGAANPETLKLKREETNLVYYELRKFLDAHFVIQNSAVYIKTINELNALIKQYNILLNNRLAAADVTVTPLPL